MSNSFDDIMKQMKSQIKGGNNQVTLPTPPEFDPPFEEKVEDIPEEKEIPQKLYPDSKQPILDYMFSPKADINTYDLARLLAFIKLTISKDTYDVLPSELKKHFLKYTEE